jgi:hypothetical protein
MKKAKVMLTAIVVLTVAGGSLAFKAKKSVTPRCLFTTDQLAGSCVFIGTHYVITVANNTVNFKAYTTTRTTTEATGTMTCTNGAGGALNIGDHAPLPSNCVQRSIEFE